MQRGEAGDGALPSLSLPDPAPHTTAAAELGAVAVGVVSPIVWITCSPITHLATFALEAGERPRQDGSGHEPDNTPEPAL